MVYIVQQSLAKVTDPAVERHVVALAQVMREQWAALELKWLTRVWSHQDSSIYSLIRSEFCKIYR